MSTLASPHTVPAHVPPELVVDVDIYNIPNDSIDPQAAWRVFQGKGPLVFSPYNGGHWIATRGRDVFKFYNDPANFSSAQISIPHPEGDMMLPIMADPPIHAKYRANVLPLFTPSAINELEDGIRELTISLIESFREQGACEFVGDYALQFPIIVFLRMMGLPLDDRQELREHVENFLLSQDVAGKLDAHAKIHAYLDRQIRDRIANPQDDAITRIISSTIDGRPYTHDELLSTLTLLLHAGLDTVAMMLGFIARHLAQSPHDREYIRNNPKKMNTIVQELLRRFAGPNLARILKHDYVHEGVTMRKNDRMLFVPSFFNMDEETLDSPDDVDLTRNARHMTFGSGPHVCAGALLARREIAIFLEEWLHRIPDFEIDPERPPVVRALQQNSVFKLWLRWDPRQPPAPRQP